MNAPRFARDAAGRLRVARGALDPVLADFLETDLGNSRGRMAEIAAAAEAVATGRLAGWDTTGNLFALTLDPHDATITPLFGAAAPAVLPLDAFRRLLAAWSAAVAA